ncbi:MAG: hypothetical protein RBT47_05550 [Anaerolineae bacterium]|jgi:hypothetical protein|nr:hypothetical protein [Anaerolineae bacterium]
MTIWEYCTISFSYDKKRKTWIANDTKEAPTGIQAALDVYGAQGWELVNLTPEHFYALPDWTKWNIVPARYRATFKKNQEEG